MFALSFCFHSKDSKRFSVLRLTDAVIQLEREIMQQKEKLNSSSTELRIMIRWCIILVSLPTVGIQQKKCFYMYCSLNTDKIGVESFVFNCNQLFSYLSCFLVVKSIRSIICLFVLGIPEIVYLVPFGGSECSLALTHNLMYTFLTLAMFDIFSTIFSVHTRTS